MTISKGETAGIVIGVIASVAVVATVTGVILRFVFGKKKGIATLTGADDAVSLKVVDREAVSHDTIRLTLALPSANHVLGTKIGQHVYLVVIINGEKVIRPYTPVAMPDTRGYVDFVIKVYRAGTNPSFPQGGKMSQYLENIPIGNSVDVRGPAGKFVYEDNGTFTVKLTTSSPPTSHRAKRLNMLAGGTGLTPMYQLLKYILLSRSDTTKIALLFANKTEQDILLRDELDCLRAAHPFRFRVWYTISEAPADWAFGVGRLNEEMFQQHLYPPDEDTYTLVCGPPPMVELTCLPKLQACGYSRDRIHVF